MKKSERVALLITELKKQNEVCASARDAHKHIKKCLQKIESQYEEEMCLLSYDSLLYCRKFSIFYFPAITHMVLFGLYGAYAIYDKINILSENHSDLTPYKKEQALVSVPCPQNKTIWGLVNHKTNTMVY